MWIPILTGVGLAGLLLLSYMAYLAFENRIAEQEISFEAFPASFGKIKIFFISDIHRRTIPEKLVEKAKADIVVIGGDLWEKGVPLERVKDNLLKLKKIGPVYFVWGNNDYEGDYRSLDALLLDLNIKVLDNTAVSFYSRNGERIALLGVDELGLEKDRLDLAILDAGDPCFRILACHNPGIKNKISQEHGISLILSGHTHGGQIRIFGFGPYKKGGIEKIGNRILLISNGYGTTGVPLRLGAPAECHLLTVGPKETRTDSY